MSIYPVAFDCLPFTTQNHAQPSRRMLVLKSRSVGMKTMLSAHRSCFMKSRQLGMQVLTDMMIKRETKGTS